jgi:hypothetical protein
MESDDGADYELRFVPEDRIPTNRQWSLVRDRHGLGDVLLTFTLGGQANPSREPPVNDEQMPSFANAIVRETETSRRFRDEFDQLWREAPGRDSTIEFLQERINQINDTTGIIDLNRHTKALRRLAVGWRNTASHLKPFQGYSQLRL